MRPPPIRKSLGQHFLTDPRILARIADAVALTSDETVVEIGPGRGSLTEALLARAARVVAIEIDRRLVELLREKYAGEPRLTIIEADVLDVNLGEAAGGAYALAGNVPYYITTPILFQALRQPRALRSVLLVQKEVAARMAAPPGADDYGALSVNVQAVADVEMLFRIPSGAFNPPPRVDSAVVRVTPRAEPVVPHGIEEPFRIFVQTAFALRRKQMRRVVRTVAGRSAEEAEAALAMAGIDPDVRPETLSAAQFYALGRALMLWT
ncbi:MAG: ribosomal RNA small subunit methyltransferase A [Gemmatimonadaceae bacterium]|nr:ribosomal RNA small subunit methyltransferase A [Gemmatimonadaceae bacterium]